ncbi:GIY-YIG nuclease family protein [Agriterribacter humi]|jgi:putative endonuclease|uniref:GIY-YIG nuclease family protein n=1 Tax=Agriterribacter humi TaxID=1104781 RepID=UPI00126534F1|nr:GIY-YIG nuclease family protein [Agriterribacter humi]
MPFVVYILYSATLDQYYTGQTENLEDRLFRHNNSGSKSTKKVDDWRLVYSEVFETRSEAVKRESEIKKKKSRKYIEWLISAVG